MRIHGYRPEVEYHFANTPMPFPDIGIRMWRFDFAFVPQRIGVEVEGGVWTRGRHTRGKGFIADIEKYNAAAVMGWSVIRCTPEMVKSGSAIWWIERALEAKARPVLSS